MGMAAPDLPDHPRILLATDRAEGAEPHLRYAARLGNALGARITLFHAVPPPSIVAAGGMEGAHLERSATPTSARLELEATASTLGSDRPMHVGIADGENACDAILRAADETHADLVVLPSHGRSGVSRAVLGSTAEQVLRHSRRPVLVLTDRMLEREDVHADGEVLLATDLSEASIQGLTPAVRLAERLGRPARLYSVVSDVEPPPYGGGAPVAPEPNAARERLQHATATLRHQATSLAPKIPLEVEARVAHDAATEIVAAGARDDVSMIALTTHGRRGVARLVQGSVAEQVLRHASAPVLVMPLPVG